MAAYCRVYVSRHLQCRLTAKNRDQLRNPTLGNRVWATFTFYIDTFTFFRIIIETHAGRQTPPASVAVWPPEVATSTPKTHRQYVENQASRAVAAAKRKSFVVTLLA